MATPTSSHATLAVLFSGWRSTGRARHLQAARDGRWEEARALPAPVDPAAARALGSGAGDLAVEFEWLGPGLGFVGARRGAGEADAFARDVARVAALDSEEPALALAALAGGAPGSLDHIELGAANAWRSVGPLGLWSADGGPVAAPLADRLAAHPRLACCAAPVALLVGFAAPRSCWAGRVLSEATGRGHVVDAARVEELLDALLQRTRR